MNQPRKHVELIKAWADGAEIEVRTKAGKWTRSITPSFSSVLEYRIKPEPKPDVVRYISVDANNVRASIGCLGNVKLTFDGETLKLKAVEMIGDKS